MKVEKAGMGDIEALVKMRLCYLIEDNGKILQPSKGICPDIFRRI